MKTTLLSLFAVLFSLGVTAQILVPQPSPFSKVEQKVGLTDVSVEYSRPGMKGRNVFGDLVPYGKTWRTGANANTIITFSDEVEIGGTKLKKGSYALYTIPKEESWEVIFYSTTNNWGVPQNWEEDKVALKATAAVTKLPFEIETFTILFGDIRNDSAMLTFAWGNVGAGVPFTVPTDAKAVANIEKVMKGPTAGDYFAAASYYHDSGKDLNKALEWVKVATSMQDGDAFWMWRKKSLIEADLGMKEQAIASAKRSLEAARKAGNQEYVKMNQESLKEWGAR